jgi:TonB family protein
LLALHETLIPSREAGVALFARWAWIFFLMPGVILMLRGFGILPKHDALDPKRKRRVRVLGLLNILCAFCLLLLARTQGAWVQGRVGGELAGHHLIQQVQPEYPPVAKSARIQGDVLLDVTIGTDGTVESIKVVRGHPLLAPAAINAVKQWRYTPFLAGGRAVQVDTQVQVNFKLTF